jgi:hypothetical protein
MNREERIAIAKKRKADRLAICLECPRFFKPTFSCKECGCFMKIKTGIKNAKCPLGKW